MTETAVTVTVPPETQDRWDRIAAQAVVKGDLSKLTEDEKAEYYAALCRSLGLNPLTRPFEFVTLNGKLVLYARRDAADQIRRNARVTIANVTKEQVGDLLVVTAYGRLPDGREDASTGAVSVRGLSGEALANAMMKAETKAKRRLTLSLVGLGFPTEDEIEDIPSEPTAEPVVRTTLAERAAAKAAAIAAVEVVEAQAEAPAAAEADVVDAEFVESMEDIVSEALGETVEPLTNDEFLERVRAVPIGRARIEAHARRLGLPAPAEQTNTDRGRLWASLSGSAA